MDFYRNYGKENLEYVFKYCQYKLKEALPHVMSG